MKKTISDPKLLKMIRDLQIDKDSCVPAYVQLAKHIISLIRKGKLKSGDMFPSISELERLFEPDLGRVTLVSTLSLLSKEGFLKTKQGIGSVVNGIHNEQVRVALIIPMFSVYLQIYTKFAAKLQLLVESIGDRLWVLDSHETAQGFIDSCEEAVYKWMAKYIIAVPPFDRERKNCIDQRAEDYLKNLHKKNIIDKIIIFDRKINNNFAHSIIQDRTAGRKLLLDKAAEKKCSSALFFMDQNYTNIEKDKLSEHAKKHEISVFFKKRMDTKKNIEEANKLRAKVIFFDSDIYATRFLAETKGKIPFKIASYDATNYALLHKPQITTIDPGFLQGAELISKLIQVENNSIPKSFVMKPILVPGETL